MHNEQRGNSCTARWMRLGMRSRLTLSRLCKRLCLRQHWGTHEIASGHRYIRAAQYHLASFSYHYRYIMRETPHSVPPDYFMVWCHMCSTRRKHCLAIYFRRLSCFPPGGLGEDAPSLRIRAIACCTPNHEATLDVNLRNGKTLLSKHMYDPAWGHFLLLAPLP